MSVSATVVSEGDCRTNSSFQSMEGENQLLSPHDIIRLDALDRLETILLIIIVIKA
jgi:hypothetical protein